MPQYLSVDARLVGDAASARPGPAVLHTILGGLPNGVEPPNVYPTARVATTDVPGTALSWTTPSPHRPAIPGYTPPRRTLELWKRSTG